MTHHDLCLDANSIGISTGCKHGVSRGWRLVSSKTAVSPCPWMLTVSKDWHYTSYVCHQSPLVSRNWASFFILKTVKEPVSACQSCSWWQRTQVICWIASELHLLPSHFICLWYRENKRTHFQDTNKSNKKWHEQWSQYLESKDPLFVSTLWKRAQT